MKNPGLLGLGWVPAVAKVKRNYIRACVVVALREVVSTKIDEMRCDSWMVVEEERGASE
jgi:hypothetical protein